MAPKKKKARPYVAQPFSEDRDGGKRDESSKGYDWRDHRDGKGKVLDYEAEISQAKITLGLNVNSTPSDKTLREVWTTLMLDAVAKDNKPLQKKIDKAKELLRNVPGRDETSRGESELITSSGDFEYTYQTKYNGQESFTSGKNLKELKDCIAADIGVSTLKIQLAIDVDGKSK